MAFAVALPEGLVRELPSADEYPTSTLSTSDAPNDTSDDLEELKRQLEALNAD